MFAKGPSLKRRPCDGVQREINKLKHYRGEGAHMVDVLSSCLTSTGEKQHVGEACIEFDG